MTANWYDFKSYENVYCLHLPKILVLRVPWTARRSNQSILKEVSPGISFEGMMLKHQSIPVLWPPHAKSWLIGKDFDAGRDWGQEEKGTTEDEMAGWHHWLDGRESEWTLGVGDRQGGLACCNSWGHKESDMTEQLNWTELNDVKQTNIESWQRTLGIVQKILWSQCEESSSCPFVF